MQSRSYFDMFKLLIVMMMIKMRRITMVMLMVMMTMTMRRIVRILLLVCLQPSKKHS